LKDVLLLYVLFLTLVVIERELGFIIEVPSQIAVSVEFLSTPSKYETLRKRSTHDFLMESLAIFVTLFQAKLLCSNLPQFCLELPFLVQRSSNPLPLDMFKNPGWLRALLFM